MSQALNQEGCPDQQDDRQRHLSHHEQISRPNTRKQSGTPGDRYLAAASQDGGKVWAGRYQSRHQPKAYARQQCQRRAEAEYRRIHLDFTGARQIYERHPANRTHAAYGQPYPDDTAEKCQ